MTKSDNISKEQINARLDTMTFAVEAILSTLTDEQQSKFKSKFFSLIKNVCPKSEPVNVTDPYRLELQAVVAQVLQALPLI